MAFKLRLGFPGAIYHVINRGNYRRWIFEHPPNGWLARKLGMGSAAYVSKQVGITHHRADPLVSELFTRLGKGER